MYISYWEGAKVKVRYVSPSIVGPSTGPFWCSFHIWCGISRVEHEVDMRMYILCMKSLHSRSLLQIYRRRYRTLCVYALVHMVEFYSGVSLSERRKNSNDKNVTLLLTVLTNQDLVCLADTGWRIHCDIRLQFSVIFVLWKETIWHGFVRPSHCPDSTWQGWCEMKNPTWPLSPTVWHVYAVISR